MAFSMFLVSKTAKVPVRNPWPDNPKNLATQLSVGTLKKLVLQVRF